MPIGAILSPGKFPFMTLSVITEAVGTVFQFTHDPCVGVATGFQATRTILWNS